MLKTKVLDTLKVEEIAHLIVLLHGVLLFNTTAKTKTCV